MVFLIQKIFEHQRIKNYKYNILPLKLILDV